VERIKRVNVGRARIVHVETELGIVNIYVGLTDRLGREVETVEMIPDQGVRVVDRRFVKELEREG
jgi:hypothetical protein